MVKPLWSPDAQAVQDSNLTKFIEFVQAGSDQAVEDWSSLYAFSIDEPERFWPALWTFCGVRGAMGGALFDRW